MHIAYLAVTSLAALMNGFAALMNLVGAEFVKVVADKVQVSQKWMMPFGLLLAAGAVGLVVGFAVTALGIAAAVGLIVYFVGAAGSSYPSARPQPRRRDHVLGRCRGRPADQRRLPRSLVRRPSELSYLVLSAAPGEPRPARPSVDA